MIGHDMHHHHHHNLSLVILSVVIAAFASYTALDLASSISMSKGKTRWLWIFSGSLAMGIGIWSMHFIGMLAFNIPGVSIFYDVPLLILSVLVSVVASALALIIITRSNTSVYTYLFGSILMGVAIAGMHYIGIASMIMPLKIEWDYNYVVLSVVVAISSSFLALLLAFNLKEDETIKGVLNRLGGGVVMGLAISSMHYIAMAAMTFIPYEMESGVQSYLLASNGLASAVILGTLCILGIALVASNIDRSLSKKNLLNETLRHAILGRDEFLNIASHELKTPLTSLKLQTQIILKNISGNELNQKKVFQMLEQSNRSIDRITRVVNDMLDISRLSTGKLHLQAEAVSMNSLILDVIERMNPIAESVGSTISFEAKEEITGQWDRFRLDQVLTNLLSNATTYAPGTRIDIKLWKEKNKAWVSVTDHGHGIAKDEFDRIFHRYERGKDTQGQRGLGIGLYIVKEMITKHNGEISVESELGKGAKFTFCLPV